MVITCCLTIKNNYMKYLKSIINSRNYFSILALIILVFMLSNINQKVTNDLIIKNPFEGKWKGSTNKHIVILNMNDDLSCELIILTKKTLIEENIYDGTCNIDLEKNPNPLTITNIRALSSSIKAIVKLINKDQLKLSYFSEKSRTRPINFKKHFYLNMNRI
jgi:hypothetical protein